MLKFLNIPERPWTHVKPMKNIKSPASPTVPKCFRLSDDVREVIQKHLDEVGTDGRRFRYFIEDQGTHIVASCLMATDRPALRVQMLRLRSSTISVCISRISVPGMPSQNGLLSRQIQILSNGRTTRPESIPGTPAIICAPVPPTILLDHIMLPQSAKLHGKMLTALRG